MEKNINVIEHLPLVPLRGLVLFPGMTLHFDVGRKTSVAAVKAAAEGDNRLFLTMQKDGMQENPGVRDLSVIGVVAEIKQIIRLHERSGFLRVVVEGKARASLLSFQKQLPYIESEIEIMQDDTALPPSAGGDERIFEAAAMYSVRRYFETYCEHSEKLTPDIVDAVYSARTAGELADTVAANLQLQLEDKQFILEQRNVYTRLEELCVILANEIEILTVDEKLRSRVDELMDKNQREYYLREEMRAISEELGETEIDDGADFSRKIAESRMPQALKDKLFAELDRMRRMPASSPDYNVVRTYIEKCLEIPFGVYTKENRNLTKAKKILERDHYGLKDVKERITEMLAALMIAPELKGQILCLAGPPGVGKTSIARSIAAATGRNYARISLGGVHDEAEIRGHRRTYLGSMPGRIISALTEAGSQNPLILLDEVDKLGADYKGDPASALLEVLDSEQNFSFKDHYIDMPVDLSKVLFVTTANDKYAIPGPLLDRMEVIDLPGYTFEEKFQIARRHLLPKQMGEHKLTKENLKVTDKGLRALIDGYTREAGVRILERKIASLCRKESVRLAENETEPLVVNEKNLEALLGPRKYRPEETLRQDAVGVVNGLAWTAVGGELLRVEVLVMDGTGKLELTGSLGDVMKESARAALSLIRSKAKELRIPPDFYKTKDIHIHFPEGAVPKDGPSAGVTVTSALVSALTGRKARADVAMTGEITLTGSVLPIGGLREKSMAAYREGISTVLIPFANVPDLKEVDDAVKEKVTFVPVKTADEVLKNILLPAKVEIEDEKSEGSPEKKTLRDVKRNSGRERNVELQ